MQEKLENSLFVIFLNHKTPICSSSWYTFRAILSCLLFGGLSKEEKKLRTNMGQIFAHFAQSLKFFID